MSETRILGNAIVIHGGGLVEPSKFVLIELAKQLKEKQIYSKLYLGRYSFEALYTPEFWLEYTEELEEELEDKRGCWFGTCRGINITVPDLFSKVIECLKQKDVSTIIVAGGDGSARQCAETADLFKKNGINIIFALPLTVDGINGGESIGLKEAVKEVIRQIENVAETSLETRDNEKFGVVVVEIQGRNRDDIMASALQYFHKKGKIADIALEDLYIIAIPANPKTNVNEMFEKARAAKKRTLILVSEGAKIKLSAFVNRIKKRKVRTVAVGHQVQSNNLMSENDAEYYKWWVYGVTELIKLKPTGSYSLVNLGGARKVIEIKDIDYYAILNPKEGQVAKMSDELNDVLRIYMA